MEPNELAKMLHEEYERIAESVGWKTQDICRVDFEDLPKKNKVVMLALAHFILDRFVDKKQIREFTL